MHTNRHEFLCANTLRVLSDDPIRVSEIPRLTGASPETSGIGWQLKPYVIVEPAPGARGKMIRLSPLGLRAQAKYRRLAAEIERSWEARFGEAKVRRVRDALGGVLVPRIAEGLIPARGTIRSGEQATALGRRDVGVAAKQRIKELVAQTKRLSEDPLGALPHYPLWDMNRGFGP